MGIYCSGVFTQYDVLTNAKAGGVIWFVAWQQQSKIAQIIVIISQKDQYVMGYEGMEQNLKKKNLLLAMSISRRSLDDNFKNLIGDDLPRFTTQYLCVCPEVFTVCAIL